MNGHLVIYSGYARSGKSCICNPALEALGYTALSTSGLLHEFTKTLISELTEYGYNTQDKSQCLKHFGIFNSVTNTIINVGVRVGCRDLLIAIAEKCLVPVFGREIFSFSVARKAVELMITGQDVAIETIGGQEFDLLLEYLYLLGVAPDDIKFFNIRRETEESKADYRQLIPHAEDLWNDGDYDDFKDRLLTFLIQPETLILSERDSKLFVEALEL